MVGGSWVRGHARLLTPLIVRPAGYTPSNKENSPRNVMFCNYVNRISFSRLPMHVRSCDFQDWREVLQTPPVRSLSDWLSGQGVFWRGALHFTQHKV